MSECFRVINQTKKEYFEASRLGECEKYSFIGAGMQGRLLALLLVDSEFQDKGLIGSWAGDQIIIAGDTNGPVIEDTQLYYRVSEGGYADITIKALAILCGDGYGEELVNLAVEDEKIKRDLYSVVENYEKMEGVQLGGLKIRLRKRFQNKA
jgi:hypothetical protein